MAAQGQQHGAVQRCTGVEGEFLSSFFESNHPHTAQVHGLQGKTSNLQCNGRACNLLRRNLRGGDRLLCIRKWPPLGCGDKWQQALPGSNQVSAGVWSGLSSSLHYKTASRKVILTSDLAIEQILTRGWTFSFLFFLILLTINYYVSEWFVWVWICAHGKKWEEGRKDGSAVKSTECTHTYTHTNKCNLI